MKKSRIMSLSICFLFLFQPLVYANETAYFAAGCFWCAEHDFEKLPGVVSVVSGYMGGQLKNPNYKQVSAGGTGHFETIKVIYNEKKMSYNALLNYFWHNVDPTDGGGQFCDRGNQYRSAIFYSNAKEKQLAEASKRYLLKSGILQKVATLILPAKTFYPAEDYHQGYAKKNPIRYHYYRFTCGRDARLKQIWGN